MFDLLFSRSNFLPNEANASQLYISSRLPSSQSSLGAGILQTALRLSISIGLAITSAIYGAMAQTPYGLSHATYPFSRIFLCTVVISLLSLVLVPFLQIGRQGKKASTDEEGFEMQIDVTRSNSQSSLWSSATARYYRGRWGDGCRASDAWGFTQGGWKWDDGDRFEVCLKCGLERVVVQHLAGQHNDASLSSHDSRHDVPSKDPPTEGTSGKSEWCGSKGNTRS